MFFGAYCVPGDEEMDKTSSFFSEPTIWFRSLTCGKHLGHKENAANCYPGCT